MDEETPLLASVNPHLIEAPRNRNLKSQILGSTLALLAAFLFAWNAFFVKEFHQDFVDVIFVRSLIQIVIFGGLTWKKSISFLPNRIEYETPCQYGLKCFLMIFQGICATCFVIFMFVAVLLMPLGDASTITFSCPIFCMIFSAIFLGENFRSFKVFAGLLFLVGVFLVVRPSFLFPIEETAEMLPLNKFVTLYNPVLMDLNSVMPNETEIETFISSFVYVTDVKSQDYTYLLGIMAGLASAISGALLAVSVNYLKDVHNNLLLFYTGVGGLLCTFVLIGIDTKSQIFYDPYHVEWGHLAIIVVPSVATLWMCMIAYQLVSPTIVSILDSKEIVFAFIIESVAEHTLPSSLTLIGAFLVVLSAMLVPLEEYVVSKMPLKIRKFI